MRKMNIIALAPLVSLMLANTPASGQEGKPVKENATGLEQTEQATHDPSRITYLRLYCTPDGNSHFQTVIGSLRKTDFAPPAQPLYAGNNVAASMALFGGFDAGWGAHDLESRLYHPTPAVQFLIILAGEFSITATDGETRKFRPGAVLRLEDTAPCKGHITVVGDKPGLTMFVQS
jgi:uncharacterized cupin superfamily protein